MKKRLLVCLAVLLALLPGCSSDTAPIDSGGYSIACTTHPVYLLANTIAGSVDGVTVTLVIDQQVSCLHDYTLTMQDMRTVEQADVIVTNGAGLEDFLDDVLDGRTVIDCSAQAQLLYGGHHHDHETEESDDHDHEAEEPDPHLWMDPAQYAVMAQNLTEALSRADPEHAADYQANGDACVQELEAFYDGLLQDERVQSLSGAEIITFHDGFSYFADAFGLTIAATIEEEEGAEASARELKETISIVKAQQLPAVFTEVNGSDKAARTIAQECGVTVWPLTMIMSGGSGDTISAYEQAITENLQTIWEAYQ